MVSSGRLEPRTITSRANPTFKALRGAQIGFGGETIVVEGKKLIDVAYDAQLEPLSQWSHENFDNRFDCPAYKITKDMYRALSPTRSGQTPLVQFKAPSLIPIHDGTFNQGRFLLLDNVQEPGNAGALVRAAVAFGMDGVLWCKPCVYPFHHAAIRASAGCVFQTKHWVTEELPSSFDLPMIGAAGEADALSLESFQWPDSFILAMGNEGHGLAENLRQQLSKKVKIPMADCVESLNVAGAAHILMYHCAQQRNSP